MLPKTHPISEKSKGPSASTDTTNRSFFGTRRNAVAAVFLLGLVTHSLYSTSSYSSMLTNVPSAASQKNQMNKTTMATAFLAMEQHLDTEIIAQDTAPKRMKHHNATDSFANKTAPKRMFLLQHSLGKSEPTKKAVGDHEPIRKPVEALASCNNTTVIITSNFIPISPSLAMINKTIQSLHHLQGLCPTSPLIITVDGISIGLRRKHNNTDERLAQYVQALKETYNQDRYTILASNRSIDLTNNVQNAMKHVETEFVYVLQHDMPFVQDINHAAILKTMDEYPDVLRLVRFNLKSNVRRNVETANTCYNEATPVNAINGINLIKTWIWSDNNHLTRKSYYEEMFKLFQERLGRNPRFMEWYMRGAGQTNCS
jgi:hypothetical protein